MKTFQLSTAAGIIIALVVYIVYLTQCNPPKPCPTVPVVTKTTVDTKPSPGIVYEPGDTVYRQKKILVKGKDSMVFVPYEVIKEVPQKIDTQAVIRAYYSKRIQEDSLIADNLKVHTSDTVYQNQIIGRHWRVESKKVTPPIKRQLYFGFGGHTSTFMNKGLPTELISAGDIGLGYINKKGQHIRIDIQRTGGKWHQGIFFGQTIGRW